MFLTELAIFQEEQFDIFDKKAAVAPDNTEILDEETFNCLMICSCDLCAQNISRCYT